MLGSRGASDIYRCRAATGVYLDIDHKNTNIYRKILIAKKRGVGGPRGVCQKGTFLRFFSSDPFPLVIVMDKFYSILENIEFVCSFDWDRSK